MAALIIIAILIIFYFFLMIFFPEWVGISGLAEKKRQRQLDAKAAKVVARKEDDPERK